MYISKKSAIRRMVFCILCVICLITYLIFQSDSKLTKRHQSNVECIEFQVFLEDVPYYDPLRMKNENYSVRYEERVICPSNSINLSIVLNMAKEHFINNDVYSKICSFEKEKQCFSEVYWQFFVNGKKVIPNTSLDKINVQKGDTVNLYKRSDI